MVCSKKVKQETMPEEDTLSWHKTDMECGYKPALSSWKTIGIGENGDHERCKIYRYFAR